MAKVALLTAPDTKRCQAGRRASPMTFGPRPFVRCSNAPTVIITELVNGPDGQKGSMSLCDDCLKIAQKIGQQCTVKAIQPRNRR